MTAVSCDKEILALYVSGRALALADQDRIESHLATCADCRSEAIELGEVATMLADLQPEVQLHGPPSDGDLLLQRILRQIRAEESTVRRGSVFRRVAAVAVVVGLAVGTGVVLGRFGMAPSGSVAQPASVTASTAPGTRTQSATDPVTKASLRVSMVPATGWIRLNLAVAGIPAGEDCRIVVVSRTGAREVAGGWLVSEKGGREGTVLDGSASVPAEDVVAIEVENTDGKKFVSVKM